MNHELKLFCGKAHPRLARDIGDYLGVPLGQLHLLHFSDGESYCQIEENIRGADVFVVQPTSTPANENLMELLVMLDAFKRSSAERITAVLPYYGYARQDRKDKPRVPISSKLVADLLTAAGAHRVLTMDLHAPAIQGFFNIPVDHLFAAPVMIAELSRAQLENMVIVSPDAGGVERARAYAKRLAASLAIIDKRRSGPNVSEVLHVVGEVEGMTAIIVDDIIDTAGTLMGGAEALKNAGADKVMACFTHAVLTGPALRRLHESDLEEIWVTDTIPLEAEKAASDKIRVLTVAPLLGEAIRRIHENASVSSLFV